MPGTAGPAAARTGLDLDAAMKARMQQTFGDLSAVKNYTPPAREQAPSQSAPYTGSVTHALSDASPSPAAAGPMQAKKRDKDARAVKEMQAGGKEFNGRYATKGYAKYGELDPEEWEEKVHTPNWFSKAFLGKRDQTYKVRRHGLPVEPAPLKIEGLDQIPDDDDLLDLRPKDLITDLGDEGKKSASRKKNRKPGLNLIRNDSEPGNGLILNEPPRSQYADDYELLSSQEGTEEERKNAYDRTALETMNNLTAPQKQSLVNYIAVSEPINSYLRDDVENRQYPTTENEVQDVQADIENISAGLKNNPLKESISTYKGITDKYLAMMFQQFDLNKAINEDGTINHTWLNNNQKKLKKKMVGKTFHDKGYTSTTTEREFALTWARQKAKNERVDYLHDRRRYAEANQYTDEVSEHPEKIKGAHMVRFNLPKGANASFVDRLADDERGQNDQWEVLVDKGSSFKISDIRKMEDSDSYELVMDLLAEEKGKKKKK